VFILRYTNLSVGAGKPIPTRLINFQINSFPTFRRYWL
jgi:hypothetical protein